MYRVRACLRSREPQPYINTALLSDEKEGLVGYDTGGLLMKWVQAPAAEALKISVNNILIGAGLTR
ncbi:hypothetical protein DCC85_09930 [Paenibacillus sp. CAA11]|uniref:hypothetical protein n=1 Tax=Paenibacillus sp. CAA11 TaxID=1532905 RepID=UPI000D34FD68|nr:hypothetical protein [Paenibacillus sp. CAA11]AWB44513.1 hypothetical protein DCC85_09930 [Paenibacillus sp. CAA11]